MTDKITEVTLVASLVRGSAPATLVSINCLTDPDLQSTNEIFNSLKNEFYKELTSRLLDDATLSVSDRVPLVVMRERLHDILNDESHSLELGIPVSVFRDRSLYTPIYHAGLIVTKEIKYIDLLDIRPSSLT